MVNLVLTSDQIYALAYIMKAKYLDHYYISLCERGRERKGWINDIQNQLVSKGVLTEDFSGSITIVPEIESIIKPIYFGDKESSLDINYVGDDETNISYRFHFMNDKAVMVKSVDDGFEIVEVTGDDIKRVITDIIPAGYSAESKEVDISIDAEKISRVFVVKNAIVKVKNYVETFVEQEGVVYCEDNNNVVHSVSAPDFINKMYSTLAEV